MIFSGCPRAQLAPGVLWPSSVDATAEPPRSGPIIESYRMVPAKPPLPTDSYRPVHPVAGSHSSNPMSESLVGLMLPATRQKATGTGCAPCGLGGVKPQAGIDSAFVMVVSCSLRPISFSHGCPAAPVCWTAPMTNATNIADDNADVFSLIICRSPHQKSTSYTPADHRPNRYFRDRPMEFDCAKASGTRRVFTSLERSRGESEPHT